MTVENASTIAQFDPTRPLFNDPIVEGDDHIRLLKSVLQSDVATKSAFPSGRGDLAARNGDSQYASLANGTTVLADGLAYVRVNGSTAIPDLPGWEPGAEVYVDHFNPLPDTSGSDMQPYVVLAVAYVASRGGGTVNFIDGQTYKVSTMININDDFITFDVGDARIDARDLRGAGVNNRPDAIFNFLGTLRRVTTLAAPVARYEATMTLTSAAGVEIGDAIYLISDTQHWYQEDTGGSVRRSTLNRVKSISGNVITLENPNDIPFDIAGFTVTVTIWRGVQHCAVVGGNYEGPGYVEPRDNGNGEAIVYTFYAQDITVRDIRASVGFQGAWFWLQRCWGASVLNNVGNGKADDDEDPLIESSNMGFTGVFLSECMGVLMQGNHGRRFRHLSDGARSRDVIVRGNHAYDCHRPPFGSHNGCNDWHIDGNYSRGKIAGGAGCLWRGFNVRFTGNYSECMADTGSSMFYDTAGTAADLPRDYQIMDNTGFSARHAIALRATIGFADIANNNLTGGRDGTAYAVVQLDGLDIGHVRISGGKIEAVTGAYAVRLPANAPRTRTHIEITGVQITGYSTHAVLAEADASNAATILIVKDNKFVPRVPVTTHVSAPGTFLRLERGPNYLEDGTLYDPDGFGTNANVGISDATGTNAPTYTFRNIQWTRLGNSVTIHVDIRLATKGTLTGNLRIIGLPFLPKAGGGFAHTYTGAVLPAVGSNIFLSPVASLDRIDLMVHSAVDANANLTAAMIGATFTMKATATYTI